MAAPVHALGLPLPDSHLRHWLRQMFVDLLQKSPEQDIAEASRACEDWVIEVLGADADSMLGWHMVVSWQNSCAVHCVLTVVGCMVHAGRMDAVVPCNAVDMVYEAVVAIFAAGCMAAFEVGSDKAERVVANRGIGKDASVLVADHDKHDNLFAVEIDVDVSVRTGSCDGLSQPACVDSSCRRQRNWEQKTAPNQQSLVRLPVLPSKMHEVISRTSCRSFNTVKAQMRAEQMLNNARGC